MDPEVLIEEVRKCPVIYDQADDNYKNSEYKERVWNMISANVGAEGGPEECKKRWTSMRDQLRRTIQLRKKKSGGKQRKYKYEDMLLFLLPYLSDRERRSYVPPADNEDDSFGSVSDSQERAPAFARDAFREEIVSSVDVYDRDGKPAVAGDSLKARTGASSSSSAAYKLSEKRRFALPPSAKRRCPGREAAPQDFPSARVAYIKAEKEEEEETGNAPSAQADKPDAVDAFLGGIAATLKSLNPLLLNEVKGRIFAIAQEAELRQLQMNASGQGT